LACGYAAIWTDVFVVISRAATFDYSRSYWQLDGTLAGWLLGLLVVATLAAVAWLVTGRRVAALVTGVAATLATGTLLFYPVFIGFVGATSHELVFPIRFELGAGGALGLCTALAAVGVWLGLVPKDAARAPGGVSSSAAALAVSGLVAALVAVWLDLGSSAGTYWHVNGGPTTHDLGIALLCLIVLGAALTIAAYARPWLHDAQRLAAAALVGFTFFFPVGAAWHFGQLGVGAWTAGAGALAFLVGSLLAQPRVPAAPPAA
jgi:hypothetical protein